MPDPRTLSMFSGYGGLDRAVQAVTGGRVVAHVENDPAASAVLAHRYPGVPNLGDATAVDWERVRDVFAPTVVSGGFMCTDISGAGLQEGLRDVVTIAAGVMECGCPWADHDWRTCRALPPELGTDTSLMQAARELDERDRADHRGPPPERTIEGTRSGVTWGALACAVRTLRPDVVYLENIAAIVARGLTTVASDLAAVGYDVRWTCVRASDVGAPHRRDRWFAVAYPEGVGRPARRSESDGRLAAADAAQAAADAGVAGPQRPQPTQRRDLPAWGDRAAADTGGVGRRPWPGLRTPTGPSGDGQRGGRSRDNRRETAWGDYQPAIARWERVLGRPAPPPTDTNGRLAPRFVEWLMGAPDGWTDVPGVSRTQRLRMLGNGVVPHQAAAAYTQLAAIRQAAA